ncbi:MAG: hypothetical protein ABII82_12395 [Verrucomicrobiota bacterium]
MRIVTLLTILIAAAIHLYFSLQGWNEPVLGHHAQRQTQTAISAYWIAQGGPIIAYETPLFGPPWSGPMEFPTYQAVVAGLSGLAGIPLDQSGRAVSLLFFYLSLPLIYRLVRMLGMSTLAATTTSCLILVSPVYIFWSRTMMIESIALFLSASYMVFALEYIQRRSSLVLCIAIGTGCLAAVTKVTSFAPSMGFLVLLTLCSFLPKIRAFWTKSMDTMTTIGLGAIISIPVLMAKIWISWSDTLKSANPNTVFLTSERLSHWNFGDLNLRFSGRFWTTISWELRELVTATGWVWGAALLAFIIARPSRPLVLFCLIAAGSSGFLVFSNLYQVHDYYIYGTGYFFLMLLGTIYASLVERWRAPAWAVGALVLLPITVSAAIYSRGGYLSAQVRVPHEDLNLANVIEKITPPGMPIAILGRHYNAALPYYAHRKALTFGPDPVGELQSAQSNLTPNVFFSLLIIDASQPYEPRLQRRLLEIGDFDSTPLLQAGDLLFYASKRLNKQPSISFIENTKMLFPPTLPQVVSGEHPVTTETYKGLSVINIPPPASIKIKGDSSFNRVLLNLAVKPVGHHEAVSDGFTISISVSQDTPPFFNRRISAEQARDPRGAGLSASLPENFSGEVYLHFDESPPFTRDYDWVLLRSLIFTRSTCPL